LLFGGWGFEGELELEAWTYINLYALGSPTSTVAGYGIPQIIEPPADRSVGIGELLG